jgi:aminoglycoside phosphotransferase (APT) family kinase protein
VAAAITDLKTGPRSWIHHDLHLDNVLWRPGGTPVLLDWSGAVMGPPGVDVSVLLLDLAFGARPSLSPEELLSTYHEVVVGSGVTVESRNVVHTGRLALFPLLQGIMGWAGRADDPPPTGRSQALRDYSIAAAIRALTWLDGISTVG